MGATQLAPARKVMTEEETLSVVPTQEESAQAEPQATESESAQAKPAESQGERRKRNDVEYNWAEARKKMDALDKQNREMADQLAKLQKPPAPPEVDELDKLADDDIITKAHARKMAERMAREIAQEVIKQREAATVDDRLAAKFPDFADVVTKDAIEILKQTEPELAFSLANNPDPYAQGVAAYKLLRRLNIGEDMAKTQEKKKALENTQKPVSVNAVAKNSAIGNAHLFENGLTPELKKSLWKEMQDARKRV